MAKKAAKKGGRVSWKAIATSRDSDIVEQHKFILRLEAELKEAKAARGVAESEAATLKAALEKRDEDVSWLARLLSSRGKNLRSVRSAGDRARVEVRVLREEVRVRRQIAATLASFHLPGLSIEDACEQFMRRADKIGYEASAMFTGLGGEAYKSASRIVLDLAFNRGVRLDAPKCGEPPEGLSAVELASLMLGMEMDRSRQETGGVDKD